MKWLKARSHDCNIAMWTFLQKCYDIAFAIAIAVCERALSVRSHWAKAMAKATLLTNGYCRFLCNFIFNITKHQRKRDGTFTFIFVQRESLQTTNSDNSDEARSKLLSTVTSLKFADRNIFNFYSTIQIVWLWQINSVGHEHFSRYVARPVFQLASFQFLAL